MFTYLLKRILAMIPTLIGITLITFFIVRLAPGDPVEAKMGGGQLQSADDSGAGGMDRKADAIKAKKKLLGMMQEEPAVLAWDAAEMAAVPVSEKVAALARATELPDLPTWPRSLALSPDGSELYCGLKGGRIVAVSTQSGEVVREFEAQPDTVRTLALSPDGSTLVSTDIRGSLRIHDARTGATRRDADPLDKVIRCMVFLPDSSRFLTGCDDSVIRLHDAATGKLLEEYRDHNAYVGGLALLPGGEGFVSGGYDRKLREWRIADTRPVRVFAEHGQAVTDLALTPDGSAVVTACDDKSVRKWSLASGDAQPPVEMKGHSNSVLCVAVSPDGKIAYSGGRDESLRAWDLATGAQIGQVPVNVGRYDDIVFSRDGAVVYTAGESWRKTPLYVQYWNWLSKLARLDFQRSFIDDEPVIDKIAERLPVTLGLNLAAIFVIYLVSIPVGVTAAVKRGSFFDHASSLVLFMLWSLPSFWVATMLITFLSSERNFNLVPSVGLHSLKQDDLSYLEWLKDWGAHLILPMLVLTYGGFTALSRYARTSLLDAISQDYVRTARAKGLSENVVVFKHTLRNSMIAIVTLLGNLLPGMIGGSVIVEYIFNIRGMGLLAFEGILSRDYPVIMAVTTFGGILTLFGILLSDVLYSVVDPRITHK